MKKILTFAAAAFMVLAANAGTRVLYSQDFESVTTAAEAGWSYGGASIEITSDEFGQFIQLNQGANNGRSGEVKWGTEIYGENGSSLEDGIYTLSFDYYPKQSSNNQYNCGITVLSNFTCPANQPFTGRWGGYFTEPNPDYDPEYTQEKVGDEYNPNDPRVGETRNITDMSRYQGYLFDLFQVQRETEDINSIQFKINGDDNNLVTLNSDWYTITLVVNVNDRTVEYEIATLMGDVAASGVRKVPAQECNGADISMYAEGLYVMVARYQTVFCFDNLKVSCESTQDVANTPSVALTRVGKDADNNLDLAHRAYTINFIEGEILHVLGTDGVEKTVSYDDCRGSYEYTTTQSGKLQAWTTCNTAKSEVVEVDVDCSPIVLPAVEANVISVVAGYGKTYKLTVDNTTVPLAPQIFITYKFVGDSGKIVEDDEQGSGVTFSVAEAGTLTVTSKAFGYKENTVTLKNDSEYTERYVVDFARMTADEITAAGFTKTDDLNSSNQGGEDNWTARGRIFYYLAGSEHENEEGETVMDKVLPIGYVADDSENVLHRYIISAEDMTEEKAGEIWPNIVTWNGLQAKMLEHIGLIQDATTKSYNPVKIKNCGANDIVVVNTTNSYGANSVHPICATDDEFFAQFGGEDVAFPVASTPRIELGAKDSGAYVIEEEDGTYTVSFNLYRIDTALCKVTVFQGEESGINDIKVDAVKVVDNGWYTIDGIRYNEPTHRGLYIHNGKKVFVK